MAAYIALPHPPINPEHKLGEVLMRMTIVTSFLFVDDDGGLCIALTPKPREQTGRGSDEDDTSNKLPVRNGYNNEEL